MTREELDEQIRVLTLRRDTMRVIELLPTATNVVIDRNAVTVRCDDGSVQTMWSSGHRRRMLDGLMTVLASILAEEDERAGRSS